MNRHAATPFRIVVIVSTLLLVLGSATRSLPAIASQDDGTVTLAGLVVAWDEPWVPGEVTSSDTLQLDHDSHHFLLAHGFPPETYPAVDAALAALGADVESRATVEAGESAEVTWTLDLVAAGGAVSGSFALIREGAEDRIVTLFLAPVSEFGEGLDLAQSTITIDGTPAFDGVGGSGLQSALDTALPEFEIPVASPVTEASPVADVPEPTASADALPTENPTEEPTDASTPEPTGVPTQEPTPEPTEEPARPEIDEPSNSARDDLTGESDDVPYSDVGMVGPRAYESPQYGVEIEWTRDWELDEDFGPAVVSDPKTEQDTVHLLWTDEWAAWITVYVFDSYSAAIPDLVDYYGDNIPYGDDAEVMLAESTRSKGGIVTIIDEGGTSPTLIYDEFRYGDGGDALIVTQLISLDPDVTDAIIRAAQNDIRIDGESALTFYQPDQVGDIHEDGGEEPDTPTLDHDPQVLNRLAGSRSRMRHRFTDPRILGAGTVLFSSRVRTPRIGSSGLS